MRAGSYQAFARPVSTSKVSFNPTHTNVRASGDGTIASVYLDFVFLADGKEQNRGSESWQLVKGAEGWRIAAITYSSNPRSPWGAAPSDAEAVHRLVARSVLALHRGFYPGDLLGVAAHGLYGVDYQLTRDGTYFVALLSGEIVGAGGWSWRSTILGAHGPDEPAADPLDPRVDRARIRAFYVDPEHARRGIGEALLHHCEREARRAGFTAVAPTSTEPAVQFYSRRGYTGRETFDVDLGDGHKLPLVRMDEQL